MLPHAWTIIYLMRRNETGYILSVYITFWRRAQLQKKKFLFFPSFFPFFLDDHLLSTTYDGLYYVVRLFRVIHPFVSPMIVYVPTCRY